MKGSRGNALFESGFRHKIESSQNRWKDSRNAKPNVRSADGEFQVKVTPVTHIIENKATLDGWSSGSLKPKRSSQIKVESGKTYTHSVAQVSNGEPVVIANEKKIMIACLNKIY